MNPSPEFAPVFVVRPPLMYDLSLQLAAIDVAVGGRPPTRTSGLVGFCLGGHPAAECVLDATGRGPDHDIVVAINEELPCHRRFAERFRAMVKPEEPIRIVPIL
jgi:hypothetical protein